MKGDTCTFVTYFTIPWILTLADKHSSMCHSTGNQEYFIPTKFRINICMYTLHGSAIKADDTLPYIALLHPILTHFHSLKR